MYSTGKHQQAFDKFKALSDAQAGSNVRKIMDEKLKENSNGEVLKKIHGLIDLTSLSALDTHESIWKMVEHVNNYEGTRPDVPNIAGICTYPVFVETVRQALLAQNVKIVSVSGAFPSSQTFTEIKVAETAMAVMEGAEEIDTVLNPGLFLGGNYDEVSEELQEIKASCRDAKLKVILETGALRTAENIQKAAIIAIYSGADFIKTSTGKDYPGATLEAAYIICQVLKTYYSITNNKIGIKVSGGIRTAEEAVKYYTLVKETLGEEWLSPGLFRIGASSLAEDIEARLGK